MGLASWLNKITWKPLFEIGISHSPPCSPPSISLMPQHRRVTLSSSPCCSLPSDPLLAPALAFVVESLTNITERNKVSLFLLRLTFLFFIIFLKIIYYYYKKIYILNPFFFNNYFKSTPFKLQIKLCTNKIKSIYIIKSFTLM